MPYTAQELITRALYLSGITSRNLQVPSGDQINDGLRMLNDLLNFKQIQVDLIPYWNYIELPLIPGQEFYFLPYVAQVEVATFNIGDVRYPMSSTPRAKYYGSGRVDNISTLPFSYNYNRSLNGGNLAIYFEPSGDFLLKLMAKIFLVNVSLDTDLTNVSLNVPYTFVLNSNQGLDTSYIEYLRYALAEYICSEYGVQFNPESKKILSIMQRALMNISPPDLSMKKSSILMANRNSGLTWADVNVGHLWRPS